MKLNDGALRIFINTKGTNREEFSEEFLKFMEYIENTTDEKAEESGSGKIKRIHEQVRMIRKSEKAGMKYMQRWEELAYERDEGRKEGLKEGLREARKESEFTMAEMLTNGIESIMQKLHVDSMGACNVFGCNPEEYEKAKELIRARGTV